MLALERQVISWSAGSLKKLPTPTLNLQRLFWLRERFNLSPELAIQIAALAFSESAPMSADRKPSTAYTLSLLRCINRRLQHITEEVNAVGVALDNGLIDAKTAREMA